MNAQAILANELHKPKRVHFKTRRIIINHIMELLQSDLSDLSKLSRYNSGYKWLIVVIDTFSKKVWGRKLKRKTPVETAKAFESILKEAKIKPKLLQTDQGLEFFGKPFQTMLRKYNIHHYHTYSDKKASIVERVQLTLKRKLFRKMTELNSLRWIDLVQDVIEDYNSDYHRTIKMAPREVNRSNEARVWKNIHQSVKRKPQKRAPLFKLGDLVRISKKKSIFAKSYMMNWSEELFRIIKVKKTNPYTYLLEDLMGEPVLGSVYEHELKQTEIPDYSRIEKVLQRKKDKQGRDWIKVRFKGYPPKFDQWMLKSKTTKL